MIDVEISKLPTHSSKRTKFFVIGSNNCGELGLENDVEEMNILDTCGSLHVAALTRDGTVITWGCNDEGLDDIVIVKVVCGSNMTLALSDRGQLYDNNGNTRFTSAINKQLIFMKFGPTSHLKIADITVGENHVLVLTTNGYLYTFGCIDSYQLGRRILVRKPNGLMLIPEKISINQIRKIFARGNYNFAIDEDGMVYIWVKQIFAELHHILVLLKNDDVYSFGSNKYGQLGIGVSEKNRKSLVQINYDNYDNCKYVATGDHHCIAVNNKNKVYTWGFSKTSALGNGSKNNE
ncbi:15172_t:CDS:2 [Dentiscutata heterogama]|uniref:15172_t:CDS:1 n=1 Tax=Dentiscutata heterogama TaxID=1316150 RepID=A0ACA9LWV6_9GLOM|nr:15172_t:CDS:2 [Dentiscutata heterogama]